jgi:hypothetical protein
MGGPFSTQFPPPGRGTAEVRRRSRRVVLLGVVGVALAGLIVAWLITRQEGRPVSLKRNTPTPQIDQDLATIERVLVSFNEQGGPGASGLSIYIRRISYSGATQRCSVTFQADFPENLLITVYGSDGQWGQVVVPPSGTTNPGSLRGGYDYTSAGIDPKDLEEFGFPCVASEASVTLAD